MIVVLAIGLLYVCAIWIPRILVALVAAFIAVLLAKKACRLAQSMLAHPPCHLDYDEKPSRAQQHLMRVSLRVALDQIELRSLFPTVVSRADYILAR